MNTIITISTKSLNAKKPSPLKMKKALLQAHQIKLTYQAYKQHKDDLQVKGL